jgi:hypothetical protein
MIDAEYEAYWDCPECQCLTTQVDDEHITHNNGDVLSIKCKHDVDKGGLGFEECEHEYKVNLAV